MNAVSTVDTASVVDPKTSVSMRVQSISRINPDAPDRKKQASTTTRMGPALYTGRRNSGRVMLAIDGGGRDASIRGQPDAAHGSQTSPHDDARRHGN